MSYISIKSASATDKGAYSYNQDRASIHPTGFAEPHETCAVFDGHGTYGEEVAMWCVELLAAAVKEHKSLVFSEVQATLRERLRAHAVSKGLNVYEQQEGLYMTGSGGQPVRGGTTASVLRIDRMTGAITCTSVGDSEVRYFDMDDDAPADGITLCGDHSATSPEEYARVLAFCAEKDRGVPRFAYDTQGGRLSHESRCPFVRAADGTSWVPNPTGGFFHCDIRGNYGAYIHTPTDNEGLAMTRALGDFNMSRYGVSQDPHVVTATAPPPQEDAQIRAVVWASDGLWDLVPPADVGAVVRRAEFICRDRQDGQIVCGRPEAAATALLELAKERTRAAFGGSLGDNITVGVTYIVYPRAPITEMTPDAWEHAITRHRVHHGSALGHSERPDEREEGERDMAGKPPGTGVVFSTRRSTQRVLYRALDGSYWEIVYLNGYVNGISSWYISADSPLAAPVPVEPVADRLMGCLREVPEELDLAFLLSGSPFRRESLFAGLDDISFAEEDASVNVMTLPTEIMSCLSAAALPGSTEAMRGSYHAAADDPLHCDLHRSQVLPGVALRRSRNTGRSYGMYAPSCSGCRIGAAEEAADAADDAELLACTEWLNQRINDLADASVAGLSAATLADRREEVEGGMFRLEICDAWSAFGDPAVMRSLSQSERSEPPSAAWRAATMALAADDAALDIRRAMTIIAEATDILKTATGRLRSLAVGQTQGAGYAAYKTAMAFLEKNP